MPKNENLIHLARHLPARSEPKTGDEFALYVLQRDIEYQRLELKLWQERCAFKDLILADQARFLGNYLEEHEPVSIDELKRTISRIEGAIHRFERVK